MKKFLALCLCLLVLLSIAWLYRWDYTASKTYDGGIVKWKTDRWTGQAWIETYNTQRIKDYPMPRNTNEKEAWSKRNNYTKAWRISFGAIIITATSLLWLQFWLRRPNVRLIGGGR